MIVFLMQYLDFYISLASYEQSASNYSTTLIIMLTIL